MAAIGSIVTVPWHTDGKRWVVSEYVGSPRGEPKYARIIRVRSGGGTTGHLCYNGGLTVVETPTFTLGERVKIDGRAGEIIALGDEIRIRLDPFSLTLRGDGAIRYEGNETSVPAWRVVLENRL